jgi:hypothetical protein
MQTGKESLVLSHKWSRRLMSVPGSDFGLIKRFFSNKFQAMSSKELRIEGVSGVKSTSPTGAFYAVQEMTSDLISLFCVVTRCTVLAAEATKMDLQMMTQIYCSTLNLDVVVLSVRT